ncbi:MAG: hypothetical protein P8X64_03480 [Anaerolineales bacterium]|jgi:hypothetical protein
MELKERIVQLHRAGGRLFTSARFLVHGPSTVEQAGMITHMAQAWDIPLTLPSA